MDLGSQNNSDNNTTIGDRMVDAINTSTSNTTTTRSNIDPQQQTQQQQLQDDASNRSANPCTQTSEQNQQQQLQSNKPLDVKSQPPILTSQNAVGGGGKSSLNDPPASDTINNSKDNTNGAASASASGPAAVAGAGATNPLTSATTTTTTSSLPDNVKVQHLFTAKKWGTQPVRQDTPWELPAQVAGGAATTGPASASGSSSVAGISAPGGLPASAISAAAASAMAANAAAAAAVIGSASAASATPIGVPPSMGGDFHSFADGLSNSLGQMSLASGQGNGLGGMPVGVLGGDPGGLKSAAQLNRFNQPWRAGGGAGAAPGGVGQHNLINSAAPGMMHKAFIAGGGLHQAADSFARAPGPATSMMDNTVMSAPKAAFGGMQQRASTWSTFGTTAGPNDVGEPEWPKSTTSGISTANPANAFDLVPEFEPGKSWHGGMLMKSLDDDSTIQTDAPGISNFGGNSYGGLTGGGNNRSPTGSSYEASSGIGTWSPVVKGGRPGGKWDGDGPDGRGDNGRFDDGTAIWGQPAPGKNGPSGGGGVDWDVKTGDANNSNMDGKARTSMAGNNPQAQYNRQPNSQQQSGASASLLMSSANTSPSSQQQQHNQQQRNQQQQANSMKQQSSHNLFDRVQQQQQQQQQSNALSSQANQPNRGLGLSSSSSNVPSQQQLKHMVQQIQLAVQAGHLNPQILNQPLSPETLQLLYQLLQQIKILHTLQMQALQQLNKTNNHQASATVNVHIATTKQKIVEYQNRIAQQQATFLKESAAHNISSRQQQQMPGLAASGMNPGGFGGPTLPPGISQSGDSFRSSASVGNFHQGNNFGVDSSMGGQVTSNGMGGGHMNLGGNQFNSSSRFDQPWRPQQQQQATNKPTHQQQQNSMASPFANHNLINAAPGGMQKTLSGNGSAYGMQGGNEFARAPGPASSMMDNNMTSKPYGSMAAARSTAATWSAFGPPTSNEPEPEWPKTSSTTTSSGISAGNSTQRKLPWYYY